MVQHTSRIIGENGNVEMFYWKGSDINSEEIAFETENEMNETLAQRRSMIFEILNAGLLNDEDGKLSNSMRSKILEQLGFGIWETSHDIKALQTNNATKENMKLIVDNVMSSPLDIDDHDIHISEHTAFMLGTEFEKAVKKNNVLLDMMLNHIREHKNNLELIKNEEK
jgi:hypothetical protein